MTLCTGLQGVGLEVCREARDQAGHPAALRPGGVLPHTSNTSQVPLYVLSQARSKKDYKNGDGCNKIG